MTASRILGQEQDEVLTAYDEAIKLDPQNANIRYKKGIALVNLGREEEALAYDEAIKLDPQHADAWHKKGIVLDMLERHEEALAAYDEAIKLRDRPARNWSTPGLGRHVSPDMVPDEFLDTEIVMLIQGSNLFGD